jgi:iron complex transport system substrate-binding protein
MPAPRILFLLIAALAIVVASVAPRGSADDPGTRPAESDPARGLRIVSMNPSLTSILVSLGAAERLVGVEEHAGRVHPELASVPVVGGLFNPSVEGVVAVEPDLVVLVPSAEQRDFRRRLESFGIEVLALPNISVAEILASIRELGARVGRAETAELRIEEIRASFAVVRAEVAARKGVRTVVVLQRDPLFVVGSGSFIDEMLEAAGATNVAAEFDEPYPRVAVEWLIAAAPDVILDATEDPPDPATYWKRWPSVPAIASGRAVALPLSATYPGPYIDRSLRRVAERIHPDLSQKLSTAGAAVP